MIRGRRRSASPSPRPSRGRDERSSLLEGWGEGLFPRAMRSDGPVPSPGSHLTKRSDLSPQAGRGKRSYFSTSKVSPA
ncbi:hypothetical protein E3H11_08550 [Bradyrhizobium brasilense]|nr:hypothetical protein [Bradyrhizobium brasilense]